MGAGGTRDKCNSVITTTSDFIPALLFTHWALSQFTYREIPLTSVVPKVIASKSCRAGINILSDLMAMDGSLQIM